MCLNPIPIYSVNCWKIFLGVGSLWAVPKTGSSLREPDNGRGETSTEFLLSSETAALRKQWTKNVCCESKLHNRLGSDKKKPVTKWEKSGKNRLVTCCFCSAILMTQRSLLLVWHSVLLAMAVQEIQVWFSDTCCIGGRDLRCTVRTFGSSNLSFFSADEITKEYVSA